MQLFDIDIKLQCFKKTLSPSKMLVLNEWLKAFYTTQHNVEEQCSPLQRKSIRFGFVQVQKWTKLSKQCMAISGFVTSPIPESQVCN